MTLAAELCEHHDIRLTSASRALLGPDLKAEAYAMLLWEAGHYADARRVLAHALARRRALWWGCRCTRAARGRALTLPHAAAVAAVERYCATPGERNRRALQAVGMEAGWDTPAGCLAMAGFFSKGSMA